MKKIKILTVILLVFGGCTKEDDINTYEIIIRNESTHQVVLNFTLNDDIISNEILEVSDFFVCNYASEVNSAVRPCFDGIVNTVKLTFDNSKGYICNFNNSDGNELCFINNKNPFRIESYSDLGENRYEFIITKEDFNNAHELPE